MPFCILVVMRSTLYQLSLVIEDYIAYLYIECYCVCLMKVCIPLRGQMNIFVYGGLLNVSSDTSLSH